MKTFMLIFAFREYGAIDDVDIDLHIDVSFLDVSINFCNIYHSHIWSIFIFILRNSILDCFIALLHTALLKWFMKTDQWSWDNTSFSYILKRLCFNYSTSLYKFSFLFVIHKAKMKEYFGLLVTQHCFLK